MLCKHGGAVRAYEPRGRLPNKTVHGEDLLETRLGWPRGSLRPGECVGGASSWQGM